MNAAPDSNLTDDPRSSSADVIAVDVGNTLIKLAVFPSHEAEHQAPRKLLTLSSRAPQLDQLQAWWPGEAGAVIVASVYAEACGKLLDWIACRASSIPTIRLSANDFDIHSQIEAPQRVGLDRLAAACAAARLKSATVPAIVVDVGSAITVDLVSVKGEFCGGAILPGWHQMANALHTSTDQLPPLEATPWRPPPNPLGWNTETAMASGLYWGTIGAIDELIRRIAASCLDAPELFGTGGDIQAVAALLSRPLHCDPYLVLRGIVHAAADKL